MVSLPHSGPTVLNVKETTIKKESLTASPNNGKVESQKVDILLRDLRRMQAMSERTKAAVLPNLLGVLVSCHLNTTAPVGDK